MLARRTPLTHSLGIAIICVLTLNAWLVSTVAAQTRTLRIGDYQFTIPTGMHLERVASEAETTWPIVVDWDQQGRLLVIESGGVSKPIEEHNKQMLHRIVRLEDENGDGTFDKRTVVAHDLPFMEGILCLGQDLLVTAPPNIYRLIDSDSDGLYDAREVWFDGQTITGCANDLHGPYLGRDGWIYWCKGAFAEQQHELLGGGKLKTTAAHIFRRQLSGGPLEPVMTGGMDNPVEVASTPEGERFFTSTFLHTPGQGLRDGVAHAIYGGLFGKPHDVLDGHVRTGELMPIMVNLGAAAPSGLIYAEHTNFLPHTQPGERMLVAALFNLQKVTAHHLTPQGASFVSRDEDLVVADRIDFHPTDVLQDADGSLLIVDTGGWYNLCCPSSRVDQQTAAGGIYRLSRKEPSPTMARVNEVDAQPSIAQRLLDQRPWEARQAQLQLLHRPSLTEKSDVHALQLLVNDTALPIDDRLKCLWGLCTIGSQSALVAITQQLSAAESSASTDQRLQQAACHMVALHRFTAAKEPLLTLLGNSSPQVRRAAAEALGRLGDADVVHALLASLQKTGVADRHWQHSVTYALIELNAVDELLQWLANPESSQSHSDAQQMVAMIAIEELGAAEQLTTAMLLDGLNSANEDCRRTASQILARHPEWSEKYQAAMDELYQQAINDSRSPAATALITIISGWRETQTVHSLMTNWLTDVSNSPVAQQHFLLELLSTYANTPLPTPWNTLLASWLSQATADQQLHLARVLAQLKLAHADLITRQLLALAKSTEDPQRRIQLLAALPVGANCHDPQLEDTILQSLRPQTSIQHSSQANSDNNQNFAMRVLQRIELSPTSGQRLLDSLNEQPPRLLPTTFEAISRIDDDRLNLDMLAKLRDIPAARTMSEEQLLNPYRARSDALRTAAAETVVNLSRPPSDIEQKLDEVQARLTSGDPIRGLQLFRSNKTACSGCHRLGYVGGEIGPNLTRIGSTRTRRALLEAILFPSARLEQSYQPTKILTHDGQVFNGLITRHLSPKQFEMQLTADKSLVLSTDDVAEQEASQLSIMPSGLAELLTPEELSDLLAILEAAK